jgi:hypothetical protein
MDDRGDPVVVTAGLPEGGDLVPDARPLTIPGADRHVDIQPKEE